MKKKKKTKKIELDLEKEKVQFMTDDIEKRKKLRSKKKEEENTEIEGEVIATSIGKAPEHYSTELLKEMTASDISAHALEYMSHIQVIRTKRKETPRKIEWRTQEESPMFGGFYSNPATESRSYR